MDIVGRRSYNNVVVTMDMTGTQKSHMYFPNFIVRHFYGGGAVNYLNAEKCEMTLSENSKQFNVEKGWFSDKNEAILNREAETRFSQLCNRIIELMESGSRNFEKIKINENVIYRFFAYQIARDPANSRARLNMLLKKDGIKIREILPLKSQNKGNLRRKNTYGNYRKPSLREFQNIAIELEKTEKLDTRNLKDKFAVVLELNYTEIEYVAINVPIKIKLNDSEILVLVVAPKLAICLVGKDIFNQLGLSSVESGSPKFVSCVNERVMAHAIRHEPHEVLGTDQEYLTRLCKKTMAKIID